MDVLRHGQADKGTGVVPGSPVSAFCQCSEALSVRYCTQKIYLL